MHAPRATAPRSRRVVAGLAATAVVSAGLACMGTANAAEPDFPQTLAFTPVDVEASAGGVYATGYVGVDTNEDYVWDEVTGYVQAVGTGERISLGEGTQPSAMDVSSDGDYLVIIGTQKQQGEGDETYDAPVAWFVGTENMNVTGPSLVEGKNPYAVAFGSAGYYVAYTGWNGGAGVYSPGRDVALPEGVQPSHLATLPGAGGTDEVVVGATDFSDEGEALGTLRTISSDGTVGDRRILGPDDDLRGGIVSMDVDEVNRLTYAVSVRDMEDGPQEYGLNVIGPDTDEYVPLPDPVSGVSVSPDGETVFLSGGGSIGAYDADALDSYVGDSSPPYAYLGGDGIGQMDVAPTGRLYVTAEHEVSEDPEVSQVVSKVHAIEAPSAPTNLRAVASEATSSSLVARWTAATDTGGVPADNVHYRVTLQDNAGGQPVVKEVYDTEYQFDDLTEGHNYTLTVATTNGLFTSTPVEAGYTVAPSVAHPSAINIRGRVAVGSTLSLANTGSWAPGTALTYAWYADDRVVSTAPTLRLTKAHLGRSVFAMVRGTKEGLAPAVVYTDPTPSVALGTLAARVPTVTGKAKVGKVLTAKAAGWTAGTRLTYQWLANGKAIKGAKAARLKLKGAQAGKKITVKVTGTQAGYRTASKTSKATAKVKR
ncbi:fibronectin type III domain-containing protein [Nocardioides lijunqiniae]|uniref:fibronectin type III domain-containing protein n=1 Tax=Nocardioides lijunqiniae TaxID=2760832 RepID=UPI001878C348|nr:fibronectin type III domain-containing protein [Nocardioides lijunqiniae]